MFMGQRTDQPSPAHRTAVLPGDLPGLADQVVSWCCRSNPQRSRHYVGIYQAVRGVWCSRSWSVVNVCSAVLPCHVGARIRGERECPRSPAGQPGGLGPWSLGGSEGGFEQGSLWRARSGRNAQPPMLAAESALSPLVTHTLSLCPGGGAINPSSMTRGAAGASSRPCASSEFVSSSSSGWQQHGMDARD